MDGNSAVAYVEEQAAHYISYSESELKEQTLVKNLVFHLVELHHWQKTSQQERMK